MMWMLLQPVLLLLGSLVEAENCDVARLKCAYRTGCGQALHSYMVGCADVLAGRTTRCPWTCIRALVSLTSTEVGHSLATCDCGENNEFCRKSKENVEVCRPEVSHATADDTVVSCSVAEWICAADPLCSTALRYYHQFCKSMFHGKKCSNRCNNSLAILDRQDKAAKLRNCYCDGSEDYPCTKMRENTQRLCFGKLDWVEPSAEDEGGPEPKAGVSKSELQTVLLLIVILLCFSNLETRTDLELSLISWTYQKFAFSPRWESSKSCRTMEYISSVSIGENQEKTHSCKHCVWPWWWDSEPPDKNKASR